MESMGHLCARVRYAGRKAAASPAAGYLSIHNAEQKALVESALGLSAKATEISSEASKKAKRA